MREDIAAALRPLCEGIARLSRLASNPAVTVEGHLLRQLGEVVAALEYDLFLYPVREGVFAAEAPGGAKVQIVATFRDALAVAFEPGLLLAFKINWDGSYTELYNGTTAALQVALAPKTSQRILGLTPASPIRLSAGAPESARVPKRRPRDLA